MLLAIGFIAIVATVGLVTATFSFEATNPDEYLEENTQIEKTTSCELENHYKYEYQHGGQLNRGYGPGNGSGNQGIGPRDGTGFGLRRGQNSK